MVSTSGSIDRAPDRERRDPGTTWFRLGASEATPFVRALFNIHPLAGVALSKIIAVVLGGACIWLNRMHLISWINYFFAALVVWNFVMLFRAVGLI